MTDADQHVQRLAANWLRTQGRIVDKVTRVDAHGTDWEGSTDEGFRSAFTVALSWTDTDGRPHHDIIEGEQMESLWQFVITR